MFRRLATWIGPLIAAFAFSSGASAGPLTWSYRAVIEAGNGGSVPPASAVLSLGQFPVSEGTPASFTADPGNVFGWTALPTGSSGEVTGSGTIVLASSPKAEFSTGSSLPEASVDSFRTLLEITDGESGVRGYTYMNGNGTVVGTGESNAVQLNGTGRVQIDLGSNRYDISWYRRDTDTASQIVANVNIAGKGGDTGGGETGGPTTPEPASIALAGLGLAGLAGRRLLRRK